MTQETMVTLSKAEVATTIIAVLDHLVQERTALHFHSHDLVEISYKEVLRKSQKGEFYFDRLQNTISTVSLLDSPVSLTDSSGELSLPKNKWNHLLMLIEKLSTKDTQHKNKRVEKVLQQLSILKFRVNSGFLISHSYSVSKYNFFLM